MVRKANPALLKPMNLSAELEAVIGKGPFSRGEVVKKLWEYIKKNNLQNPQNKRNIIADAKLKPVFGGKGEVNMFEMTKLVSGPRSEALGRVWFLPAGLAGRRKHCRQFVVGESPDASGAFVGARTRSSSKTTPTLAWEGVFLGEMLAFDFWII